MPTSIRYIAKSVIGYPFFKRGFVASYDREGITARLFVVPETTETDAFAVLRQYSDFITKSGGTVDLQETTLSGTDPLYKKVFVRNYANVIVGLTNISSDSPPIELLDEVGKRASTVFAPSLR